jgi:hypothetical protein
VITREIFLHPDFTKLVLLDSTEKRSSRNKITRQNCPIAQLIPVMGGGDPWMLVTTKLQGIAHGISRRRYVAVKSVLIHLLLNIGIEEKERFLSELMPSFEIPPSAAKSLAKNRSGTIRSTS